MANKKKKTKNKSKKSALDIRVWIFIFAVLLMAIVFLPSTLLLTLGMLPTLIALVVVSKSHKNKVLTIGAMNFAGCFPYLMDIWQSNDRMSTMIDVMSNPMTIVVMYSAAGIGYIINYGVTRLVRQLMYSGAERKIKNIEIERKNIEKRWGRKVRGDVVLDINGFPVLNKKNQNDDT